MSNTPAPGTEISIDHIPFDKNKIPDTRSELLLMNMLEISKIEGVSVLQGDSEKEFVLCKDGIKVLMHSTKTCTRFYKFLDDGSKQVMFNMHPPYSHERVKYWFVDYISKVLKIEIAHEVRGD